MVKKCLLLRFPDNREVFTHERYYFTLLEFAKNFNVKIISVEADYPNLLHPKDIAKVFCDKNEEEYSTCSYRILKNNQENDRKKMLKTVFDIRSYIEEQLLQGNTITIKDLFHKYSIAVSTIYRHLAHVKEKLQKSGKNVEKISTGCYRVT
jgi:hypothetical protein